jgi:hypothetical protein
MLNNHSDHPSRQVPRDTIAIPNHHVPECGSFPDWALSPPPESYFGYFENEHGEQWALLATPGTALLAGGDCGWDQTFELRHPDWRAVVEKRCPIWPDLILDMNERTWLNACLQAAAWRFQFARRGEA